MFLFQIFFFIQFNYSTSELSFRVTRADSCQWMKLDRSITCILHVWKTPSNLFTCFTYLTDYKFRRESKPFTLLCWKKSINKYRSRLQQLVKHASLKRCIDDCRTSRCHWLALWAGLNWYSPARV